MSKDMPSEIWASKDRTFFVAESKFSNSRDYSYCATKYHHDNKYRALEAERDALKIQIKLLPNGKVFSRRELEAENKRLLETIKSALYDIEYGAFNLTNYTLADVVNVIDTTCSEKSLLMGIRDLRVAVGLPITEHDEEQTERLKIRAKHPPTCPCTECT